MPTQSPGQATVLDVLPELLCVIDGTLVVPTEDDVLANVAFDGLRYLTALAFSRQQPGLACLYELDFERLETRVGSRLIDFRIFVRLRDSLQTEVGKVGAIAVLGVVLALPGAINESLTLWDRVFPPVEEGLAHDLPQCPPNIQFVVHAPPEKPNPFHSRGRSFDL